MKYTLLSGRDGTVQGDQVIAHECYQSNLEMRRELIVTITIPQQGG